MNQAFIVSNLEDENDGDFSAGDLSLREAIAQANDNEGADTIGFDSSLSGQTLNLSLGELKIEDSLTIISKAAANLGENPIIDANESSRVFNIDDGNSETNISVSLQGINITGGDNRNPDAVGGGIFNRENLSIFRSGIDNNNAIRGGGIANQGKVIIQNSRVVDNGSTTDGGGILNDGDLTILDNSVINNNTSSIAFGAGISNNGTADIVESSINNNRIATAGIGAGVYNNGTIDISSSLISGNSSGFAGAILNEGTANVSFSTIQDNEFTAIASRDGTLNIQNSTITNNRGNVVGGIEISKGTISNSTITNNSALDVGGISGGDGVTISSSIIANNTATNDNTDGSTKANDISGEVVSGGNNLIGDGSNAGDSSEAFVDGVNGDIVGSADNIINPLLGELQNNRGRTPTQALLEGSPAIDAGSNPNNLETDQRGAGFNRTVGNGTDIGAYEVQESDGGGQTPTDLVVSTLVDENDGDFSAGDLSLREAISLANEQEGEDTITFDQSLSGGTISFGDSQQRDLNISDSVSINGLGQDNLTLNGGFIFDIADANTDVAIDGLNLTGGKIDSFGNFTLTDSTISQTISRPGSSDNSAIISRGTTTISDSTISDNNGGGNVGILVESGTTNIERSTIANNQADYAQSGIIVRGDATVDISNSTIANNQGRSNAGIENAGTAEISNTTIANNTGGLGAGGLINFNDANATVTSSIIGNSNINSTPIGDISGDGKFTSGGNNLISNGDDATGFVDSDIVGTADNPIDPQLGELQNNGGATETLALLEDSTAIDAGSNPNNLETDQQGEGFNRTVGNGTDIGAYEVQEGGGEVSTNLVVSTLEDENDGDFSAGDLSLREAIANSNAGDIITFDSNLSGGTIALTSGELMIDKSLTINGLGANNLIIDGNDKSGIFLVDDSNSDSIADVSISGLTITNGNKSEGSGLDIAGGGFLNQENLTIADTAMVGNKAGNGGAIYNTETGNLQLNNSLVTESDGTGPIYNDGGSASISNTTIANNDVDGIGAIVNYRGAELGVTNSTITNNNSFDAAVFNSKDSAANFGSTIIAGNIGEVEPGQDDIIGAFDSSGGNLIGNTKGGSGFNNPNDLVGTADNPIDPLLGELQDNGGLTQTIALQAGSPAIDAGNNFFNLATDQRGEGFNRTVGNTGELGGSDGTDIGAFEVQELVDNSATEGNDTLIGTDGNDLISGLGGDDLILGKDGHDSLNGNNGKDIIFGDAGDDLICGGNGSDLLFGGGGNDTIDGGAGKDIIFGGGGNNTIVDSAGEDIIIDNLKNGMQINEQEIGSFLESYGHDLFSLNNFDAQNSIAEVASNSDFLCF